MHKLCLDIIRTIIIIVTRNPAVVEKADCTVLHRRDADRGYSRFENFKLGKLGGGLRAQCRHRGLRVVKCPGGHFLFTL